MKRFEQPVAYLFLVICLMMATSLAQCETRAAQRIIALAPHTVELLFTLGVGDRIIAATEHADFPEAAKSIPTIGGYHGLHLEKILAYEPDLVIAWEGGNRSEDIERIEALGLNVYRSHIESIDEIASELEDLGRLAGVQDKAKRIAKQFTQRLNSIKQENEGKRPVRFFYQLWQEPLKTVTAGSWIDPVLRYCGGINIFPDGMGSDYPQVSIENVLVKLPEAIIIPSHHGKVSGTGEHWEKWPEIPAVKHQNIFYINGDILHRSSTRVLQGMEEVCRVFDQVRG